METILFVLANSAIAAVISSITAALVNKLQQDRGYKQDYYKEIISKRLRIYERIERQIAVMNSSIADVRPYHLFFENNIDGFHEYQRNLFYARSCGIWLSEESITQHGVELRVRRRAFYCRDKRDGLFVYLA